MLEGLLESLAEYYSVNLAKHVKRGMRECVLAGHYTGGSPPFGFKVENKKLVADENTAPVIRYVFEQYAKGVPKKEIIDELNKRGVLSRSGRSLTLNSLQHVFRNKKYIGKYIYDGQEVVGGCEALISEEVFNAVQNRLDAVGIITITLVPKRKNRTLAPRKTKKRDFWNGLLWSKPLNMC